MNNVKRALITGGTTAGLLVAGGTAAFATPPAPPTAGDAITEAAGSLSSGVVDTTVSLIPYAVPVLLLAWGFSTAKNMIGTRKKAAK